MKYPKDQDLTQIGNEVLNLARAKGFPITKDATGFLIERVCLEAKEIQESFNNDEASEHTAEECIDVIVQCIQLIKVLGYDPADIYRKMMDTNWQRKWDLSELK